MRQEAALSIIVPVYNLESCISATLDSILRQTYRDFELILVDDGSTDGSLKICRDYEKKDDRVTVLHKENGGVSSARNLGLERAGGAFISFVDGDDLIEPEMYERLMDRMLHSGASIACCMLDRVYPDGRHVIPYPMEPGELSSAEVAARFFQEGCVKECMYGPYNKVFRRNCLEGLRFQPYRYAEDILFVFEALCAAKSVWMEDFVGYHYVMREGSAMKSAFSPKRIDYVKAAREVEKRCEACFPAYAPLARQWVYRHSLNTVRSILQYGLAKSQKAFVTEEKQFLKANASCLAALGFRSRATYWLVMYFPFLIKIIF